MKATPTVTNAKAFHVKKAAYDHFREVRFKDQDTRKFMCTGDESLTTPTLLNKDASMQVRMRQVARTVFGGSSGIA
jgi:hypothetical protein